MRKDNKKSTFSQKIDIISENIVYCLSIDSRKTVSELAKILNVSRRIVDARYRKLFSRGYIRPLLIFNSTNYIKASVFIKLHKFDSSRMNKLRKIRHLIKFKETVGAYDLSLLFVTESKDIVSQALKTVNNILGDHVQYIEVVYHDMEDTLGYKSFCHDASLLSTYHMLGSGSVELTKKEIKVVRLLKVNPLASYSEIIGMAGISFRVLKEIIQSLLKRRAIRFSVDPDYNSLGLEFHNLLLKVNPVSRDGFEKAIMAHRRVHWVKRGYGRWDYIISIAGKSISEFIDTTREIRASCRDIVFDSDVLISKINLMRKI